MSKIPQFKPSQIVCLEQTQELLYGEVIQIIESRKLCWLRPLMLVIFPKENVNFSDFQIASELWDLRFTMDVVYPLTLFRAALDTEVLPLMMQLEEKLTINEVEVASKQRLQLFLKQIWQKNSEYFQEV